MYSSLIRTAALVAFVFIHASASAQTRPVNDTGVIACKNEVGAVVTCESVNVNLPGQDAAYGRDALSLVGSLSKTGGGQRGFDLTKLGNDGGAVPSSAAWGNAAGQFRCVRDNTTGLVWEAHADLRSWRDPNPLTNGGFVGTENIGSTTDARVMESNAANRCGRANSWRLPTVRELIAIADFSPGDRLWWADNNFFSSVQSAALWTSQTNPAYPEHAFLVGLVNHVPYANPVHRKLDGGTNKTATQWTVLVSSQ